MSEVTLATRNAGPGGREAPRVAVVCVAALAASVMLVWRRSDAYQAVLGIAHPVAATAAVVGLGFAAWIVLVRRGWIPAQAPEFVGYRLAAVVGLALPIPVIIVDCFGGFGPEINVPAPDAILFYPSIAVVAEFVLHVAPLAVAALAANLVRPAARPLEIVGLAVAVIIEPVLQVFWGMGSSLPWANAYVGVHLLVFNVLGVYLLRRYGVLRVFLYRLSYYLVWHIAWGYVRLLVLFSA